MLAKFETCFFSSFSSFNGEEMGASTTINETSLVTIVQFHDIKKKESPALMYHETDIFKLLDVAK